MNPTGHTTADMIFTGLMLVLHLAALAGLGYMLGRMHAAQKLNRAKFAAAEVERLRLVVRDCARTLQHNLSMWAIKDEPMMLRSLRMAWNAVGRSYCEASLPENATHYTPTGDTGEPD